MVNGKKSSPAWRHHGPGAAPERLMGIKAQDVKDQLYACPILELNLDKLYACPTCSS